MKRGKKGQFYIIAAVIIIGILLGTFTLTNLSKKKLAETKIYDLGDELGIETGYVYDYGVYQEKDLNELINRWSDIYLNYTKSGVIEDWIFVYGNKKGMTALTFTTVTAGKVGIYAGGSSSEVPIEKKEKWTKTFSPEEENIVITVPPENLTYDFNLKTGENFFFVLRSKEGVAGVAG